MALSEGWSKELDEAVRGLSAGMLFGIPLLYTMEVWWIGSITNPARMLVVLAVTFFVVLLLNRTGGFRSTKDVRLSDAARDSVEAMAIALLSAFGLLLILREIDAATPMREGLGKVIYEATPFAFGVGLARHFLQRGRTEGDGDDDSEGGGGGGDDRGNATVADVGATLLGAVFVAFNIAPTDEVPTIAAAASPMWLIVLIAASLAISYCIVFEAGFSDQQKRRKQTGIIQDPLTETLSCYLLAVIASGAMLAFFRRFTLDQPPIDIAAQMIVLGLPAAVGGAAGRLAV
ncbi:MAG TPA: TIGR02587 family membrane protein [Acidimicrobiales bacterium]|nr:TIGR02587 family membrane protein [Acidimicrobiales bacterium]